MKRLTPTTTRRPLLTFFSSVVGGVGDLALEPAVVDAGVDALEDRAVAELVEVGEDGFGLALHLVGHPLDVVRAAERVGDLRHAGLVGDDLLGAQGDAHRLLGGQGQGLVEGVGVQALVPPSTPASASMATRAMLTSGCWAVSDTPAVWVWKRSCSERGLVAP